MTCLPCAVNFPFACITSDTSYEVIKGKTLDELIVDVDQNFQQLFELVKIDSLIPRTYTSEELESLTTLLQALINRTSPTEEANKLTPEKLADISVALPVNTLNLTTVNKLGQTLITLVNQVTKLTADVAALKANVPGSTPLYVPNI